MSEVSGRRTALFAGALLATVGLVAMTGAFAQGGAELAGLGADDLWAQAEQARADGEMAEARRIYAHIVEHHGDNESRASWALYRLCMFSYNERDIDAALGYIQKVVDDYPDSGICRSGYAASYLTAIHLLFTRDYAAAIEVGEEHLARFGSRMGPVERARVVERLARSYVATDEADTALATLTENATLYPHLLRAPEWYQALFLAHVARGDQPALLSAARAAYAMCDFDEKAIRDAADLVRQAFARSGEVARGVQFLQAQEDDKAPNPLRDVPLPDVSEEQREQLLQAAGDDRALRLLVFIYCGDDHAALTEAIDRIATAGTEEATAAVLDVARAFKAVDLNLVRANQFLEYARSGEGLNPLTEVELR
ncbi:MAG: tetratricopeptide repeat protein [Armatimonadota bacterium]|jgi:tetratricopeptide (TPR) repeat protein